MMLRCAMIVLGLTSSLIAADVDPPTVLDDRLSLDLVAAEPQIVTPTGIAVDAQGRVLVVECHTHFRPENYQGPTSDRIRRFSDANGDGTFEKVETLFDGAHHTMSVALNHGGQIHIATRNELFRLEERNPGQAAEKRTLVRLETKGDYPHNGLSGFAFDLTGHMYFGMGENLGVPFELIGSDGRKITGAEGGHIFRCQLDGSQLERFATGFWNPFSLAFDAFGRLFAVDNDPDSLPPCRLMQIVAGGDYGYKFRNGRKGLHPFTAWNGELPGTLPMVAGTGEAPSGVVAYESNQLPADYLGALLVTSWGDHRIEAYPLQPRGASLRAQMQPIVRGGEDFRPVGIALAPDGSLFISDWVDKSYPVHGRGRIWRLRAKAGAKPGDSNAADVTGLHSEHGQQRERAAIRIAGSANGTQQLASIASNDANPRARAAALRALAASDVNSSRQFINVQPDDALAALAVDSVAQSELPELLAADRSASVRAAALRRITDVNTAKSIWPLTDDTDAYLQQAARLAVSRIYDSPDALLVAASSAGQRLAALLIVRSRNDDASRQLISKFAQDIDADVRFATIQWIGEERLTAYRDQLDVALRGKSTTPRLFAGYLAAIERLERGQRDANDEWSGEQYGLAALLNDQSSAGVRRFALRSLRPDHPELTLDRFKNWIAGADAEVAIEAVRSLRTSGLPMRGKLLLEVAKDERRDEQFRAEAMVGLSPANDTEYRSLVELAAGRSRVLRHEALRSLRGAQLDSTTVGRLLESSRDDANGKSLVSRLTEPGSAESNPPREETDAWLTLLQKESGDARAGERIFFHPQGPGCFRCHTLQGRGGNVGPDLSRITLGADRRRLLESILNPSREVAPQFTTWLVRTSAGKVISGILLHDDAQGNQTYGLTDGTVVTVPTTEIEERQASRQSIMPENMVEQMTIGELADLLALLGERAEQ